jgi:cytochrome b subunit of formate dehydrogenase
VKRHRALAAGAFIACVAMFLFAVTFGLLSRDAPQSGSWSTLGAWAGLAFVTAVFTYPAAGLLLAMRRPENPIGWLLLTIGVSWGFAIVPTYSDYAIKLHHDLPGADIVAVGGNAFWLPAIGITGTFLLLLFPDGHLPGRRWRYVAWVSAGAIAVGLVCIVFGPGPLTDAGYPGVQNPLGIDAIGGVLDAGRVTVLLIPLVMLASAVSLVVRYRRAYGVERQQLKWLAAAASAVVAVYAVVVPLGAYVDPTSQHPPGWLTAAQVAALVSFALIPVAIVFAVLRYRLYEIDVLIRRTLVYAVLITSLAVLYLVGVYAIQGAVRSVSGQSGTLAVTVSTLLVAAAFQPLRARIQRAVDHRFYRGRYDAARTLESFSGRLREQVEIETVSGEVLDVVRQTLQPAHVSLWLRSPEGGR